MAGFEVPQHGIHGIGVYALERDPRWQNYDDDLKGPRSRVGVYTMRRGEDNSEPWIHMLDPISNSCTGRDASLSSLRACEKEADPELLEEGSQMSVAAEFLFRGWRLQKTTDYEDISTEVKTSLSHPAG